MSVRKTLEETAPREPKRSKASKAYRPTEPQRPMWSHKLRAQPQALAQGGMAQTSRDSHAADIPQRVTARTRRAGRSGTHKPQGRGGAGAGAPPHPPTTGGGTGVSPELECARAMAGISAIAL